MNQLNFNQRSIKLSSLSVFSSWHLGGKISDAHSSGQQLPASAHLDVATFPSDSYEHIICST